MVSEYRRTRRKLRKILPKGISFFPGRVLSEERQQLFIEICGKLKDNILDEDLIFRAEYKIIRHGDNVLITDRANTFSVIAWFLDKNFPGANIYRKGKDVIPVMDRYKISIWVINGGDCFNIYINRYIDCHFSGRKHYINEQDLENVMKGYGMSVRVIRYPYVHSHSSKKRGLEPIYPAGYGLRVRPIRPGFMG